MHAKNMVPEILLTRMKPHNNGGIIKESLQELQM
jgi:hypothetical protein